MLEELIRVLFQVKSKAVAKLVINMPTDVSNIKGDIKYFKIHTIQFLHYVSRKFTKVIMFATFISNVLHEVVTMFK